MHGQEQKRQEGACDRCSKVAVTFLRYSGAHLCSLHFNKFFVSRVKKELRRQGKILTGSTLGVAISGGKDSLTMLHVLVELLGKYRNLRLVALTIDEGIHPYRTNSLAKAEAACKHLGVEHRILSFKSKYGYTLDEMVKMNVSELLPCSFCGVLRRSCLNTIAREVDASKLAVGHNLDDNAQSILMNICKGDYNKLFRLGPHRIVKPKLIPRLMPLRVIPEKEIYLYTYLNGIDAYTSDCPYAEHAQRGMYRSVINQLEHQQPGTRFAILNMYDRIYDAVEPQIRSGPLNSCRVCGEPSTGRLCKACEMLQIIKESSKENK